MFCGAIAEHRTLGVFYWIEKMQGHLKIKNWSIFQHYKDRNPPWIKLHVEILTSRTWVGLDDASRVLAIASMVIASKNDGWVPLDPEYMQRVAYLSSKPNFNPLIKAGFFEDASTMLADASALQADARPETETETETDQRRGRVDTPKGVLKPDDVSDEIWADFLSHRKAKKAKVTETALKGIRREAIKAGWTIEMAMQEICSRGWTGFNAEWVNKEKTNEANIKQLTNAERLERASRQALDDIYAELDSRDEGESIAIRQLAAPEF